MKKRLAVYGSSCGFFVWCSLGWEGLPFVLLSHNIDYISAPLTTAVYFSAATVGRFSSAGTSFPCGGTSYEPSFFLVPGLVFGVGIVLLAIFPLFFFHPSTSCGRPDMSPHLSLGYLASKLLQYHLSTDPRSAPRSLSRPPRSRAEGYMPSLLFPVRGPARLSDRPQRNHRRGYFLVFALLRRNSLSLRHHSLPSAGRLYVLPPSFFLYIFTGALLASAHGARLVKEKGTEKNFAA